MYMRNINIYSMYMHIFAKLMQCCLKGIDYLQVLFFIIEPRGLKFGMRM